MNRIIKELNTNDHKSFFNEIITIINSAKYDAFKSVNKHHIGLNFEIGKQIVINQEKFGWGKSIVNSMSNDIIKIIDGIKEYSPQNLWKIYPIFRLLHSRLVRWVRRKYKAYKINDFRMPYDTSSRVTTNKRE